MLLSAGLHVALLVHTRQRCYVLIKVHLKRLHAWCRRAHQNLIQHLLVHLFQCLFAQKVDSLVYFVAFHLVKSAILLTGADLVKDVLHFTFVPLEQQLLESVYKVRL